MRFFKRKNLFIWNILYYVLLWTIRAGGVDCDSYKRNITSSCRPDRRRHSISVKAFNARRAMTFFKTSLSLTLFCAVSGIGCVMTLQHPQETTLIYPRRRYIIVSVKHFAYTLGVFICVCVCVLYTYIKYTPLITVSYQSRRNFPEPYL